MSYMQPPVNRSAPQTIPGRASVPAADPPLGHDIANASATSLATSEASMDDYEQQIEDLYIHVAPAADQEEEEAPPERSNQRIAVLFCRRAAWLLSTVNFDATASIPDPNGEYYECDFARLGPLFPSGNSTSPSPSRARSRSRSRSTLHRRMSSNGSSISEMSEGAPDDMTAVRKAQEDATAALALEPAMTDAHILAAQCARCLCNFTGAREYVRRALYYAPEDRRLILLDRQLAFDLQEHIQVPALLTTAASVADAFDLSSPVFEENQSVETAARRVEHESIPGLYAAISDIAKDPLLQKFDQIKHYNVHHVCADALEAHELERAMDSTLHLLAKALQEPATHAALELDPVVAESMLPRSLTAQDLLENAQLKTWILEQVVPGLGGIEATYPASFVTEKGEDSDRALLTIQALLHDTFLVLIRELIALSGIRRCSHRAHPLRFSSMAHELCKALEKSEEQAGAYLSSEWAKLRLLSAQTHALAMAECGNEREKALKLLKWTIKRAMATHNADAEVTARHLSARLLEQGGQRSSAEEELLQALRLCQEIGDHATEALVQYELGVWRVADGKFEEADESFEQAETLCHQTAHFGGTWRSHSMDHARDFYSSLNPHTSVDAVRSSPGTSPGMSPSSFGRSVSLPASSPSTRSRSRSQGRMKSRRGSVVEIEETDVKPDGGCNVAPEDMVQPASLLDLEKLIEEGKKEMEKKGQSTPSFATSFPGAQYAMSNGGIGTVPGSMWKRAYSTSSQDPEEQVGLPLEE